MSEREELLDETYNADNGWERAVLHLALKVPQRLDSPDQDNGLGLIQEILDEASFDITVEPLDLAAHAARIREDALKLVRELADKWELHAKRFTAANDLAIRQDWEYVVRSLRAVIDTPAQADA